MKINVKKSILFIILMFCISGLLAQDYVGPEKCLQCHGNMTGWRTTMHANGYSIQLDDTYTMQDLYGIVNDYDENGIDDFKDGLDFNDISSVFDPFKPNAPVLAYDATDGYTITIGDVTGRVILTYGGSGLYKQRYAMKMTMSNGITSDYYISPIQYNEKTHEYVLYHASNYWVDDSNGDPTNVPVFSATSTLADVAADNSGVSLAKGCSGCHLTGLTLTQDANGEWNAHGAGVLAGTEGSYTLNNIYDLDGDGDLDQINTGCEVCHGAGGDHATAPSKTNIINPKNLTADEANNICGMCHSRGKSLPNKTFSFPYDDTDGAMANWVIGDMVADHYTDGGGYYGDGLEGDDEIQSSKSHHQQFYDLYESSKPGFMYHEVTCYECHDVHNTVKHQIRAEIVEEDSLGAEIIVATENDNNTLCLACHATHGDFADITVEMVAAPTETNNAAAIAAVVTAHSNHSYDPTGTGESRCSKCHMPKSIKSAVYYDIHSHTFEAISPQKTLAYGMPNACAASCHRGIENGTTPLFNTGVDATLKDWTETTDVALADSLLTYFGPNGTWWAIDQILATVEPIAGAAIPEKYSLHQNFPNPFNPTTTIKVDIMQAGYIRIALFNVLGQELAVLMEGDFEPGQFDITVNSHSLSTGIYFYTMTAETPNGNTFIEQKKMMIIK